MKFAFVDPGDANPVTNTVTLVSGRVESGARLIP